MRSKSFKIVAVALFAISSLVVSAQQNNNQNNNQTNTGTQTTTTTTSTTQPSVLGNSNLLPQKPWEEIHIYNRKPVVYLHEREADMMWAKRVWRIVDLREKINLPLFYPTEEDQKDLSSLWKIIKLGLTSGQITAYGRPAIDDEFQFELPLSEVNNIIVLKDTQLVQDINTGEFDTIAQDIPITSEKITRYWIKEDWFFDKQRSVMEVRIMGIAPMIEKIDKNTGDFRSYEPLFWLYFPQCRPIFAQYYTFNRYNDVERRTFDEVFHKRLFSSFITKEANVYGRAILQYTQSMGALLESDRIKNDLFLFEHDLWHF